MAPLRTMRMIPLTDLVSSWGYTFLVSGIFWDNFFRKNIGYISKKNFQRWKSFRNLIFLSFKSFYSLFFIKNDNSIPVLNSLGFMNWEILAVMVSLFLQRILSKWHILLNLTQKSPKSSIMIITTWFRLQRVLKFSTLYSLLVL